MNFNVDATLFQTIPNLKVGLNHYTKITVSSSPQMLKGRLQLFQEQLFFDLYDKKPEDFPGINEWRDVWTSFGANPNTHQHSTEALMQRIAKQNYLQSYNSAVDLNAFFSLQYEIPIGIYDINKITGPITTHLGNTNTTYEDSNGRLSTLNNILSLSDEEGLLGSPYVNSARTAVTEETTEVLQVFFLRPSMDIEEGLQLITAAGNMFINLSGGNSHSYLLHEKQSSIKIDLN